MSNNVLVIPGADFSNVAVKNILELCNPSFSGDSMLGTDNAPYDASRMFMLSSSANYHNKPIAKLRMASTGTKNNTGTDGIGIYEAIPKSGTSEGTYVFDEEDAQLLFDITWNAVTGQMVDVVFPRVVIIPTGRYLAFKVHKGTNLEYDESLGLLPIITDSKPMDYQSNISAIGIYSIE